jgi:hypothetical protein
MGFCGMNFFSTRHYGNTRWLCQWIYRGKSSFSVKNPNRATFPAENDQKRSDLRSRSSLAEIANPKAEIAWLASRSF